QRRPCMAGEPTGDRLVISNTRGFPLFCVEVGEWRDKRYTPPAYLPRLGPHERVTLRSEQRLPERGEHRWNGYVVATRYPFGFALKLRVVDGAGSRLVWPRPLDGKRDETDGAAHARRPRRGEPDIR